jgi:hypothetical protein
MGDLPNAEIFQSKDVVSVPVQLLVLEYRRSNSFLLSYFFLQTNPLLLFWSLDFQIGSIEAKLILKRLEDIYSVSIFFLKKKENFSALNIL